MGLVRDAERSLWSHQPSGSGQLTLAAWAAERYSWTVLCEIEQLRAI
jgi:hypothetical protein